MSMLDLYMPQVTDHGFRFVPDTYVQWFTSLVLDRYLYFAKSMNFFDGVLRIPSAQDVLVFDIDSHGASATSPVFDFASAVIGERIYRMNPDSFPDPSSYEWTDENESAMRELVVGDWDKIQSDILHDMEIVFRAHRLAFHDLALGTVVNNPIIEVW